MNPEQAKGYPADLQLPYCLSFFKATDWKETADFKLPTGTVIKAEELPGLLWGLHRQGLVNRRRSSVHNWSGQRTITKYLVSPKGRKLLKGLGL